MEVTQIATESTAIPTINSREVAEMMEIRHTNLMRKIEGINEDFENSKVSSQKYWLKSTYKIDGNNKTYKCYEVTKMGCEFLAHKSIGTRGNIFTAKYMDRFEEMKQALKENTPVESYRISDPIERAKQWIAEEQKRQEQAKQLQEQAPKVEYHDKVLNSFGTYTPTQIANDYGISAMRLNNILKLKKIQFKVNTQWVLYQKYKNEGYAVSRTSSTRGISRVQLVWTEKGRQFIHEVLKAEGIHPVTEKQMMWDA